MSPALVYLRLLIPNRQVPKSVGTEMRALVASWGLLLHDEGAWGAVGGCRGLFGRQFWGSRVQKKKFENFGEPSKRPKAAKSAPKCPPRGPKMSPREPRKTLKSIFIEETPIYQKVIKSLSKIKVFEGRRVRLGGQIQHQEGPRLKKQVT